MVDPKGKPCCCCQPPPPGARVPPDPVPGTAGKGPGARGALSQLRGDPFSLFSPFFPLFPFPFPFPLQSIQAHAIVPGPTKPPPAVGCPARPPCSCRAAPSPPRLADTRPQTPLRPSRARDPNAFLPAPVPRNLQLCALELGTDGGSLKPYKWCGRKPKS